MSLQAMQNCVIIEEDVETHEMFIIPSVERMETGIVRAAGPDCKELKVGDHVYFGVGQEFKHEGKDYIVIREPHVLGVLE
jgi:co-chaperonin GroES (HSP10)